MGTYYAVYDPMTFAILEYRVFLTAPDSKNWIKDPDVAGIRNVPQKYWKTNGQRIWAVTEEEKKLIDASDSDKTCCLSDSLKTKFGRLGFTAEEISRIMGDI